MGSTLDRRPQILGRKDIKKYVKKSQTEARTETALPEYLFCDTD